MPINLSVGPWRRLQIKKNHEGLGKEENKIEFWFPFLDMRRVLWKLEESVRKKITLEKLLFVRSYTNLKSVHLHVKPLSKIRG